MPFRFHCSNCQQRLSVSSRKRGQEVKCPRCRRVIVVPASDAAEATTEPPLLNRPMETFPDVAPQSELVYAERVAEDESSERANGQIVKIPRYVLYTQGFLLGAVALAFFIFGLIIGSRSSTERGPNRLAGPATVSGAVLYEEKPSPAVPDAGSVIVLLPVSTRPDEKAAATGLRPSDPEPPEDHPALTMLRSLGGDYTRADRRGRYQVHAKSAGRYYLLVISKRGRRISSASPEANELAQLGRYFLPATELLGQQLYQWKEILLRADEEVNVTF